MIVAGETDGLAQVVIRLNDGTVVTFTNNTQRLSMVDAMEELNGRFNFTALEDTNE